jgi:hypothetical protein
MLQTDLTSSTLNEDLGEGSSQMRIWGMCSLCAKEATEAEVGNVLHFNHLEVCSSFSAFAAGNRPCYLLSECFQHPKRRLYTH